MSEETLEFKVSHDTLPFIHEALLDALKDLVSLLDANKITYFIDFGTLLGAVRQQDFIGWDDDIDITIFKEDHAKIIELVRLHLPEEFEVLEPGAGIPMMNPLKLSLKGTRVQERELLSLGIDTLDYFGLSIDLFHIFQSKTKSNIFMKLARMTFRIRWLQIFSSNNRKSLAKPTRLKYRIVLFFGRLIPDSISAKMFNWTNSQLQSENSRTWRYSFQSGFWTQMLDSSAFSPAQKLVFRGVTVSAPNNANKVLQSHYGDDYLTPPVLSDQKPHSTCIIVERNSRYFRFFEDLCKD